MVEHFIASFLTTEYDLMKKHWEANSVLAQSNKVGTNKPIGRDVDMGGAMVSINWGEKKEQWTTRLSCPSGMTWWNGNLTVASMRQNKVYVLNSDQSIALEISHPHLNDIHSISATPSGNLLVTSTGLDSILEFDNRGTVVWEWNGTLHGYNTDQFNNQRDLILDTSVDHRTLDYPTLHQATHINSCIASPRSEYEVLATFFHQGTICAIDKQSGNVTVLIQGLRNPHSIRKVSTDRFIFSDTQTGEVHILTGEFEAYRTYQVESKWLQDAFIAPKTGNIIAARSDHSDIVEIDTATGKQVSVYRYNPNWRIYGLLVSDSLDDKP